MATVAVYSLKGGVGKTTIAVNLAWCAATLSSRRTLLWDLDPQAAATFLLAPAKSAKGQAQAAFTRDVDVDKLVRATPIDRLDIIGADTSLRGLDLTFHDLDKKKRLAKLLSALSERYDRIILDCPPGLTETTEQVMRGVELIVAPVIPSPLATRAFDEVSAYLDRHGGKNLKIMPVHSMVDRRRKLHAEALARHPDWPAIPMASVIETMATKRAPIGSFAGRTAGAQAFAKLWQDVERALAKKG